jgi:sugar lactone lactonase YvrE
MLLATAACGDGARPDPCAESAPPVLPAPTLIKGPPGAEDFTFDRDGYLLALDSGRSLVRVARGGSPTLVAPNVVAVGRGLRVLPGGDVVIADLDRSLLVRLDAAGGTRRLTSMIGNPNGLALGPAGKLYATDFGLTGEVFRVDPDSGDTLVLATPSKGSNGIAFSPDHRTLYVGDHLEGLLYRMEMKDDGTAGPPQRWAEGVGEPDGLAVDACGNVYAASWLRQLGRGRLYRVSPQGVVALLLELPAIVSAVAFGSGKQGWDARSLYLMAIQEGGVFEVPIDAQAAAPPR